MLDNKKIGFIGGGAMAEAIITGLLKSCLCKSSDITVSDIAQVRLEYLSDKLGVNTSHDNKLVAKQSEILFLAVKPQVLDEVVTPLVPLVSATTLILSIAAGVNLAKLEDYFPYSPVIRIMPNAPLAVGEGMSAITLGKNSSDIHADIAMKIFSASGKAILVEEYLLDGVTGLSGSGPGYGFIIIDALADAGVRVGLSRQTAIKLAAQTLLGAAKMVLATGKHPAMLRDIVTSPGGTTIAGVHVLEQRGVRAALIDAVVAAAERSKEMGNF